MYDRVDLSILGLASEFFAEEEPSEKELKVILSRKDQRDEFIKWVDNKVSSWVKE